MIHTNRCNEALRTGKCKHCGKTKEHHFFTFIPNQSGFCDHASRRGDLPRMYQDSGLAALDAHKEELWEAVNDLRNNGGSWDDGCWSEVVRVMNQIEKEK